MAFGAGAWDQSFGIHFDDLNVTTIGVDVTGRVGAFGTLDGVFLVDLTRPTHPTKTLPFNNQYHVRTLHWNKIHAPTLACSSNNQVLIWDTSQLEASSSSSSSSSDTATATATANSSSGAPHIVLDKHKRSVNDIEWQAQSPHVLASCSSDAYVYVWDIREPSTEQRAFTAYRMDRAGVSQLAWNRFDGNILASAHGGVVRLWDMRNESLPVQCIRAHESQIFGIDWSYTKESELMTCALDKLVKFWDVNKPDNFVDYIQSSAPIRRAKYTPFGNGLVTASASSLTELRVWSRSNLRAPVHAFASSSIQGQPTDFVWRSDNDGNLQLLSWSSDSQLRFWALGPDVRASVGAAPVPPRQGLLTTEAHDVPDAAAAAAAASPAPGSSPSFTPDALSSLPLLEQEVKYLKEHPIESAVINRVNTAARILFVTITVDPPDSLSPGSSGSRQVVRGRKELRVRFMFPASYPDVGPSLEFVKRSTFNAASSRAHDTSQDLKNRLKDHIQQLIAAYERESRPALQAIVAELAGHFALLVSSSSEPTTTPALPKMSPLLSEFASPFESDTPEPDAVSIAASFVCPRLGGAFFGPSGTLLYWNCFSASLFRMSNPAIANNGSELGGHDSVSDTDDDDDDTAVVARPRARASDPSSCWPAVWADVTLSIDLEQHGRNLRPSADEGLLVTNVLSSILESRPSLTAKVDLASIDRQTTVHQGTRIKFASAARFILASPAMASDYAVTMGKMTLPDMCHHNAAVARRHKRPDLVRVWLLCAKILSLYTRTRLASALTRLTTTHSSRPWATHPFARRTVASLFDHYMSVGDVQSLAVLSCLFTQADALLLDVYRDTVSPTAHTSVPLSALVLVDESMEPRANAFRRGYCRLLHAWGLLPVRAEVAKCIPPSRDATPLALAPPQVTFANTCVRAPKTASASSLCVSCPSSHFLLKCSVCRQGVKNQAVACLKCGHGGHVACLKAWYAQEVVCPTGCGCMCLTRDAGGKAILTPQVGVVVT